MAARRAESTRRYFGIDPDDSEAFVAVVARRENIAGYFAGHTHRNRVRRFAAARNVPFVEVACTKDYPGAWAEYRVYEGGYTQVVRRVTAPDAFDWAETDPRDVPRPLPRLRARRPRRPLLHRSVLMEAGRRRSALEGIRVVDMATVIAAPARRAYLADFGADVVKVESPTGDGTPRSAGATRATVTRYIWKLIGRNKRTVVLDLKAADGSTRCCALVDRADVLVENLRPGTLERLGLAPADLHARNPGLVMLRVTGFGQDGPYAERPGLRDAGRSDERVRRDQRRARRPAAAPADRAHRRGHRARRRVRGDGRAPPPRPHRRRARSSTSACSSRCSSHGPAARRCGRSSASSSPGSAPGSPTRVPRGTYRCADGVWVAVSTSAESVAQRVLDAPRRRRRPALRRPSPAGVAHRDELDDVLGAGSRAAVGRGARAFNAAPRPRRARLHDGRPARRPPRPRARGTFVESTA